MPFLLLSMLAKKNELPQPNIITESGRSLTAHHSVLVFEALASTSLPAFDENEDLAEDAHELVKELYDLWEKSQSAPFVGNLARCFAMP